MIRQKSIAKLFSYGSIVVIAVLTLTTMVSFISSRYINFGEELKKIENQFIEEQIQLVKSRVNDVISYIDYRRSHAEDELKEKVKEMTYYACDIASGIFNANRDRRSQGEIKQLIRETLRPIRFFKNRGYYFIDDLLGNIILYPLQSQKEAKNPGITTPGKFLWKEFIDIARSQGEGFTTYNWFKEPNEKGKPTKKISYIKLFAPYNWIIGTGEYVENVEADIRESIINRIAAIRFGKNQQNYFFLLKINDPQGEENFSTMLVNPNRPDLVGKPIPRGFKDERGHEFIREMAFQIFAKGETVVNYWFRKMISGKISLKTTYFQWYKDWNWLIGAGFHHDDMEALISLKKKELRQVVFKEVYLIIGIFIMISFLAVIVSRIIAGKIKNEFDVFSNFFRESAKKNELLDKNRLKVNEFRELADLANRMIIDKREAEEAILKAKEAAEIATQAKSEFLANVSHEIRTPMNAIIGMSDILAQTPLTQEQYEYLEIITTSANNLLVIINDILDLSKIEAGRMEIDRINFSIREIIEGAADMIAPRAHKKGLELITLIEPGVPEQVLGDSSRLHQILLNLATNAIKFTDKGEIVLSAERTELTGNEKGIKILFKVKDTGIGISQEDQEHLFKTFSQLDTASTRRYGGTGLGLAISRKLTQLMKGEIGVKSLEGLGSTFWFTCLFEPVEGETLIAPISTAEFKNLNILIVDDNRTNRLILRKYLEVWKCRCDEAENAWQAVEIMRRAIKNDLPFNIILVDFQMPEVSGVELAALLKKDEPLKNIPLILLSSSTAYQTNDELRKSGFDAILYKPIKQSQLSRGISQVMGLIKAEDMIKKDAGKITIEMPPHPLNILLVEDNTFNQKVAIFNLQKYRHTVDLAINGKIAVDKFKTHHYDLILMDVQMPVMDGYEATRKIRELEREKSLETGANTHIPIIAMTANAMKEDEEKSFASGMDAHLAKPFTAEKLLYIVHKMAFQPKENRY